jgi:maltooligosyltrehalose trehalohydrolase
MIFMGEEWAASTPFQFFTDFQEAELAASVKAGRKNEFGGEEWNEDVPDPQDIECFRRSKLVWKERSEPDHRGMSGWYAELIRLRMLNGPAKEFAAIDADLAQGWIRMRTGQYAVIAAFGTGFTSTPFVLPESFAAILSTGDVRTSADSKLEFVGPGVIVMAIGPDQESLS